MPRLSLTKGENTIKKAAAVINENEDLYISISEDLEYNYFYCERIFLRQAMDEIPLELFEEEKENVKKELEIEKAKQEAMSRKLNRKK